MKTDAVESGNRALKSIKDRYDSGLPSYKLIFLDYSMPEKDGPQTAIDISNYCLENSIQKPYICCVTAYSEARFKNTALASGMDRFIVKPIQTT